MITTTVNDTTQAALDQLKMLTEIRSSDGRSIGYFLPSMPREELALYLKVLAEYDPDEIRRRKESKEKGRTTAEVLAHLKDLEHREGLVYERAVAHFDRVEMEKRARSGPTGAPTSDVLKRLSSLETS